MRCKLYEAWKKEPCSQSIRNTLRENNVDPDMLGWEYIKHFRQRLQKSGAPKNGSRTAKKYGRRSTGGDQELLSTGKFIQSRRGIFFSEEFQKELESKYPEQSIEDGIRAAGIDPDIVGYDRIYKLKCKIGNSPEQKIPKKAWDTIYTRNDIEELKTHPYVWHISEKKLTFCMALYREAYPLMYNGYTKEEILEIFEIPISRLSECCSNNIQYRFKYKGSANNEGRRKEWDKLNSAGKAQYIRIQAKLLCELEKIANKNFLKIKESIPRLRPLQKKHICEWIRDEVPKEKHGKYSLRGILKSVGISKSFYYDVLSDETYESKEQERELHRQEEICIVREVADYGGYLKGSRQIYMQMDTLTGRHMSRGKIMKLMREAGIQSQVRKANPARRGALKHLKKNLKPNLLKRTFRLHRPGEVYLTDVTYLKYGRGKLAYGSASIDSVTGRVYSFDVSDCQNLELVEETLRNLPRIEDGYEAVKPMLHSDQGALYLTDEFQELVVELGFVQSMSKRGNCQDNAPQESFFGHFKDECPYRKAQTMEELRDEIQRYFHYYNEVRGHWSRNKMTPIRFEEYLRNMSEDEFQEWLRQEEKKYNEMKRKAKEKAIERARTLGV